MTVAAVVLAAGAGTRFAGNKLRAPFRGRALACWALEAAHGAGLDETLVVTGADDLADLVPAGVRVLANPRWVEGLATSLAVGIAAASERGHDAVVVGLADQPLVGEAAWQAVAQAGSPIGVADFAGRRCPPVRLDRSVWALLPTTGDEGARALMACRPDLVGAVPCPGDPVDIDTQEDLARWS